MPGTYLKRSINTELAVVAPRPALRGRSHLLAALFAWPATVVAVLAVGPGVERLAVASFGLGAAIMFTCSALLHLRRWDPIVHERLFRLDHSGIYCTIGGTTAAIALLGLDGWVQQALLVGAGIGTGVGIVLEWLPFAPPRGLSNTVYITLGWLPILVLPYLWVGAGPAVVLLIIAGGVLYTSGAIIVALRRPDVLPGWFGYHELFHVFVIAAVLLHARAIALLLGAP
jgi:hemolysin III